MNYNQRFTAGAEQVLRLAQEAAAELGHGHVGSEHILLGLAREGSGAAAQALASFGVTPERILDLVIENVGRGSAGTLTPQGLTPRTKRIIELAMAEAMRRGRGYIGTEHLLMGILREPDCFAARILALLHAEPGRLYPALESMLGGQGPAQGGASQPKGGKEGGETKTLNELGRDLTAAAQEGKLDPVIGREKEIERVVQILSRRTKNNPCLIGEPGVGKTAIAEGLAQKIVSGDVPENLRGKRLVSLEISSVVAGTKYRGEFEERIKTVLAEVQRAGDVILFIDEMHTLIGAGAAEGAVDAANILKPMLSRGEIQIIGATTLDEYRRHIEKDAALERRFQSVQVAEPSAEDSVAIVRGLRDRYEAYHKLKISDEAIDAAVQLSIRYISDRHLPDKAIDLVYEAASRKRMKTNTAPPDLKTLEEQYAAAAKELEEAISGQDFEKAAFLRDRRKALNEELEARRSAWRGESAADACVDADDIAEVVASWTGIPVAKLTQTESERLMHLEETLHRRVIGQDEAVRAVAKAIRRSRVGLKDPNRPTGSFIFLGPTGVGKTELARALAEAMFGDENAMLRVDMSEYMEKYSVSRLIGSPPGYVGYDEGGQLTERVRRRPYSVILFDEIEKAHPDVFNILLQILDDGILTDSQGRKVDFKNTVIIMTSNIGARRITEENTRRLGFGTEEDDAERSFGEISRSVMDELRRAFRPEFLNRIDEIIVFRRLEKTQIRRIAELMMDKVAARLYTMGIALACTDEALDRIADEGYDAAYGARPLRRFIQSHVEDAAAECILAGQAGEGSTICVTVEDGALAVQPERELVGMRS